MIELDLRMLLIQAATFLVALGLLRWLAYKPLMALLDARAKKVASDLEAAEKARGDATKAIADAEQARVEALRSAEESLRQAAEEARRSREDILREANARSREMLNEAENRIAQERDVAMRELRDKTADLAVRLAEKVLAESINQAAHDRLVDEAVDVVGLPEPPGGACRQKN